MTRISARLRVAHDLLALEAGDATGRSAAVRVCEKLRRLLTKILGATGFITLLRRALTLAKAQTLALSAVEVKPDGTLDHADELDRASEIILVGQLLDLLVTFVGAAVTTRILQDAWPTATIESFDPERQP